MTKLDKKKKGIGSPPGAPISALEQQVSALTRVLAERVTELDDLRRASFNLWEDLEREQEELKSTRKATTNLLDDLEQEREKLIEAKAKDAAVLASIGDGLVATDRDGNITMVNGAFEKMLGWRESEVKGQPLIEMVYMSDENGRRIPDAERLSTKILKGQTQVTAIATAAIFERKDGLSFPVSLTIAPIVVGTELIGVVEVFRDTTKEKELDRIKGEFISIASHQLRTPLTGIQWVIERFTKKEKLTPKGVEYLNDIHVSAKRLTEMVDLLLNLSRIEAGRVVLSQEPIEVIGFIRNYIEECRPLLDKKGLKLIFDNHPNELHVMTDKNSLHNIIQSLVSNAIEYTGVGGSITIVLKIQSNTFRIEIEDTGIGIPISEQSRIFEKFVRASNAKLYKTDGTGIGLFIAERATYLLGGKIWFESPIRITNKSAFADGDDNAGSRFYVELPVALVPQIGHRTQ